MNEQDLINFEKDIKDNYEQAKIRAPVHLCGGNEERLIKIFEQINEQDWVFSTHRSHYHALLKTKDPTWVKEQIFLRRSSHLNSKKHKFFTSAIVGGICSIALGVALAIKRKEDKIKKEIDESNKGMPLGKCELLDQEHVWCFVGDMAGEMGIFYECLKYADNFNLPITFIIEDNGFGVYTPTREVWGYNQKNKYKEKHFMAYSYKRVYPHYGIGSWVTF